MCEEQLGPTSFRVQDNGQTGRRSSPGLRQVWRDQWVKVSQTPSCVKTCRWVQPLLCSLMCSAGVTCLSPLILFQVEPDVEKKEDFVVLGVLKVTNQIQTHFYFSLCVSASTSSCGRKTCVQVIEKV